LGGAVGFGRRDPLIVAGRRPARMADDRIPARSCHPHLMERGPHAPGDTLFIANKDDGRAPEIQKQPPGPVPAVTPEARGRPGDAPRGIRIVADIEPCSPPATRDLKFVALSSCGRGLGRGSSRRACPAAWPFRLAGRPRHRPGCAHGLEGTRGTPGATTFARSFDRFCPAEHHRIRGFSATTDSTRRPRSGRGCLPTVAQHTISETVMPPPRRGEGRRSIDPLGGVFRPG
jgi:hypothetical protein